MFWVAGFGKKNLIEAKEKHRLDNFADSFLCLLKRLQKASLVG
jgi:hypothetical protein